MLKEDLGDLLLFDTADRDMFRSIFSNFELVEGLEAVSIREIQSQEPAPTLSTITSEQTSSWPANSARVSGCFWGPSLALLLRPMVWNVMQITSCERKRQIFEQYAVVNDRVGGVGRISQRVRRRLGVRCDRNRREGHARF